MAKILRTTVEDRIRNGYEFKFGEYFSYGFNTFQKEWLMFVLYALVGGLLFTFSVATIIGFPLIMYPLILGFSVAAEKIDRDERIEFGDFFGAFKNIGEHFIVALLLIVFYLILCIPIILMFVGVFNSDMVGATTGLFVGGLFFNYILLLIGIFLFQIFVFFAPYLIHFGDYTAMDAIKVSFNLAKKRFGWMLLFVFVTIILSNIGQYVFLIGILITFPVGMLTSYGLVKDVLMSEDTHREIEEIGSHINY